MLGLTSKAVFTILYTKRFVFEPGSLNGESHAATATLTRSGDLLAAWYTGAYEGAPGQAIYLSRFDEEAWSMPQVVAAEKGLAAGNPVLYAHNDGSIWLFYVLRFGNSWATCKILYKISEDDGHSWSNPITLVEELGYMTRNPPIQVGGRLILPIYDERDWSSLMLISEDEGETWRFSSRITSPYGAIQPTLAQLKERLAAYLRPRCGCRVLVSFSFDDGVTWSEPIKTGLKNPNSALAVIADRRRGLLAAYNDSCAMRTPLSLASSGDAGIAWKKVMDVESGEGEYSYPAIVKSRGEIYNLLYTYNRETIAHVTFDEDLLQCLRVKRKSGSAL